MLDLRDFGAIAGGPDCTPAFNEAVKVALSGPDKTVWISSGEWFFMTSPQTILGGVRIIGEGKSETILTRSYSNGEFLVLTQNGSLIRDLTIWAGAGTAGGIAIHAIADNGANGPGGNHRIQDAWITSGTGGTWAIPIYLDGLNRTLDPIGIRTVRLDNVTVFNGTAWAMEWWNAVACEWYGGGAYQGAGTTQNIAIGGPLGQSNLIHAHIPGLATSTISTLRSPVA